MRKKGMSTDLTEGPVIGVLLGFTVPILLANLLETAYNLVDMVIVGQFMSSVGLSAVSIGSDIMHLINLTCNGLCNGAQILIAQYMGAKDKDAVNRSIGTLFTVFVLFAVVLTAVMLACSGSILRFMNTPEEAWGHALSYTVTCYLGLIFVFGYGLLGAVLRGMGDSKHPLLFIGVAAVVNLILDLLFVAVFRMGTFGAALATVIGQGLSFVWALSFLYRRRKQLGFDFKPSRFRLDRDILPRFLNLGVPMCLQNVTIQAAGLYVNSFVYSYGVVVSAVTGIGAKLVSIVHIVTNAQTRAGAVMIGQCISAGKTDRVSKVVVFNACMATTWAAVLSAVTVLFPKTVFGIFTTDAAVLKMAELYVPVVVLRYFAFASRSPNMALINGIGKPILNYALGLLDGIVVRVGLSLYLGLVLNMGVRGFWYGNALGGFSPLLVGGIYFLSGKWRKETPVTRK